MVLAQSNACHIALLKCEFFNNLQQHIQKESKCILTAKYYSADICKQECTICVQSSSYFNDGQQFNQCHINQKRPLTLNNCTQNDHDICK